MGFYIMTKVIGATQFFNELDLLQIRLETLDPVVDYFIISESTKTHSGLNKPLYYEENKSRYKKFHHKIVHQIVRDTPKNIPECRMLNNIYAEKVINSNWFDRREESYVRDTYEKEVLLKAIGEVASPYDMVLFGDLDEIPKPESVEMMKTDYDKNAIYYFKHDMFYYYLNLQKKNEDWIGTLGLSYEKLVKENKSLCEMRTNKSGKAIYNAGWHFTYMGGVDKIRQKINSWGEQSLNTSRTHNHLEDNVKNCIRYGRDLFFRPATWEVREINDGTFPPYLVENQEKFGHMIYKV
jgi:beta-1,4-mannosyl-glycoprotein beta-1,4-N-acetylglucosaminyltransferase